MRKPDWQVCTIMRIAIFSESYKPLINGVSTSVDTLIAELERAGHTVFVFTSHYPKYKDDRSGVYRYPSINAIVEPDYVIPIPISPSISRIIPTLKLDIVHSQSPFFLGLIAKNIARKYAIPFVSTNHTLYTEYSHYVPFAPPSWTRKAAVSWMRKYYNWCDHVLAPSDLTRDRLVNWYGVKTPVTVVPTGIPEPPYILASIEETKQRFGIPSEGRILLYVGRLAPEKNLFRLLDAFAELMQELPDLYLVLAGSGKSTSSLRKRAAELDIDKNVVFTGFLNRTKLDPLYRASEVFVFPSKTETQGLAVGEALAAGTPCVVVNEGGAPESVSDGMDGFLVKDDTREIVDATLRILKDPALRHRMSEAAKVNTERLRPHAIVAQIIGIYEGLINGTSLDAPKDKIDDSDKVIVG